MQPDVSSNPVPHRSIRPNIPTSPPIYHICTIHCTEARRRRRRAKVLQAMDPCSFFTIRIPPSPFPASSFIVRVIEGCTSMMALVTLTSLRFRTHFFIALPSHLRFSPSFLPSLHIPTSHSLTAPSRLHFARAGPAKPLSFHHLRDTPTTFQETKAPTRVSKRSSRQSLSTAEVPALFC